MKKLAFLSQASDAPIREKQILLAPFVLKRYALNKLDDDTALDIKIIDFNYSASAADMAASVISYAPDVLAISVYLWNYREVMECARLVKEYYTDLIILVGGPMVAYSAMQVLVEHSAIDYVCIEDRLGELVFAEFCRRLITGEALDGGPGLAVRRDGAIHHTPPVSGSLETEKRHSPFIAGDIALSDPKGYYVTFETSRGCPYNCGYCAWGGGSSKMNFFPIERVLEEIEIIYNNDAVKHVLFVDSNMNLKRDRLIHIIEHMRKQRRFLSINTRMHLQINLIDEPTARALATLPNFSFDFGLQTANMASLEYIGRRYQSPDSIAQKVSLLRTWLPDARISIDLMLGLPGDTLTGFEQTLDFCLRLDVFRIFLAYPVCLLPGTRFYDQRDTAGFIYTQDQPLAVMCTKDFPLPAIKEALVIGIWMQIILYYYDALREAVFLHFDNHGINRPGERICFMKGLIKEVEQHLGIFETFFLEKIEGNYTKEFYIQKGQLLKQASTAHSALTLFETIRRHTGGTLEIETGICIHREYLAANRNPVGATDLSWIKARRADIPNEVLSKLHSRFVGE